MRILLGGASTTCSRSGLRTARPHRSSASAMSSPAGATRTTCTASPGSSSTSRSICSGAAPASNGWPVPHASRRAPRAPRGLQSRPHAAPRAKGHSPLLPRAGLEPGWGGALELWDEPRTRCEARFFRRSIGSSSSLTATRTGMAIRRRSRARRGVSGPRLPRTTTSPRLRPTTKTSARSDLGEVSCSPE